MPHNPHDAPERLVKPYRDVAPDERTAKYWGNIAWLDETCGELFQFLDDEKLSERTLVVFVCDNGWIQDPLADRYAPRSKQSPNEGGVRTPILFRLPGKIAPGTSERAGIQHRLGSDHSYRARPTGARRSARHRSAERSDAGQTRRDLRRVFRTQRRRYSRSGRQPEMAVVRLRFAQADRAQPDTRRGRSRTL
ncbi:MAG: sulfatase-like hydrolase/transferase [Pirellulales bacterium]